MLNKRGMCRDRYLREPRMVSMQHIGYDIAVRGLPIRLHSFGAIRVAIDCIACFRPRGILRVYLCVATM